MYHCLLCFGEDADSLQEEGIVVRFSLLTYCDWVPAASW